MSATDIFGKAAEDVFIYKYGRVQIRELFIGGIPSSPSVIRAWLRAKLDMEDQALNEMVAAIAAKRETEGKDPLTTDQTLDAIMKDPDSRPSINGFLRTAEGRLLFPTRCIKSCMKEAANSSFPGKLWPGKIPLGVQKGCSSSFVERVFVMGEVVPIIVDGEWITDKHQSVGNEERVKHVKSPQGAKSVISRVETVKRPTLDFTVKIRDHKAFERVWPRLWASAEEIGLGADRARGDGRFDLVHWGDAPPE